MDKYTTYCSFFTSEDGSVIEFGGRGYLPGQGEDLGLLATVRRYQLLMLLEETITLRKLLQTQETEDYWHTLRAFTKIQSVLGVTEKDHDRIVFRELRDSFGKLKSLVTNELIKSNYAVNSKAVSYYGDLVSSWAVIEPITLNILNKDCHFNAVDDENDELNARLWNLVE